MLEITQNPYCIHFWCLATDLWQVRMAGDGWLKSIHHQDADFMPIDTELLDDSRRLATHFGLEIVGVDYIVAPDGSRHLLEVNHIPNVTVFPEVRRAYLVLVVEWASRIAPRPGKGLDAERISPDT